MKPEQKSAIIFTIFGAAMGAFSTYIGILVLSFAVPIAGYIAMLFLMSRIETSKKMKWIVTNSIMSFLLVWLVSWIFIFNIG